MLGMLRDLIAHKWYASASLLNAIRQCDVASCDVELRTLIHHILVANRFWLLSCQAATFEAELEMRVPDSLEALIADYRTTHKQEMEWLAGVTGDRTHSGTRGSAYSWWRLFRVRP